MTAQLSLTTELEKRDEILDSMKDDGSLQVLRRELAELYRRRVNAGASTSAWVCADDARRIMSRLGMRLANNNRLGALFTTKDWEWTGHRIKSETPGSHGNEIKAWKLRAA